MAAQPKKIPPGSEEGFVELKPESGPGTERLSLTVPQAGLVLLHPYIIRLLENTGMKDKGRAQLIPAVFPRAASLLHYLASGQEEVYEFDLGLEKVILGLPPGSSLPVSRGLLSEQDKEEADTLLRSVINHWSVLKNTSPQGLRVSFLERPGLLNEEEDGWRLRVERKTIDVLLDHLPWSIGIVKLPWMKTPLYTEW